MVQNQPGSAGEGRGSDPNPLRHFSHAFLSVPLKLLYIHTHTEKKKKMFQRFMLVKRTEEENRKENMAKTSCHFWAELSYSGGSRTLEARLSLKSSDIKAHLLTRIHFLISVSLPVIGILCLLFFPSLDKVSDYQTHGRLCLPECTHLSLKLHVLAEKSAAYVIRTEPHLSRKVFLCMKKVKGCLKHASTYHETCLKFHLGL